MHDFHDFIVASAVRGNEPEFAEILAFCEQSKFSPEVFCNEFSILVAKGFLEATMSYEFCDCAMNYLWGFITSPLFGFENAIPELAFAIYEAFDQGEYYHSNDSRDIDPREKYTRPMITEIFGGLNSSRRAD